MPLLFIPDTVEASTLEIGVGKGTKVRGGLVTGLSGDPATALDQCLSAPGIPTLGTYVSVGGMSLLFDLLRVRPVSADTARVELVYNNNFGGATAYIISNHSFEQSYQTSLLPGTRIPLFVPGWANSDAAKAAKGDTVAGEVGTITISRTMRWPMPFGSPTGPAG